VLVACSASGGTLRDSYLNDNNQFAVNPFKIEDLHGCNPLQELEELRREAARWEEVRRLLKAWDLHMEQGYAKFGQLQRTCMHTRVAVPADPAGSMWCTC